MEQARRGDVMKDAGILAVRAVGGPLLEAKEGATERHLAPRGVR
jgi:hypothetical protein